MNNTTCRNIKLFRFCCFIQFVYLQRFTTNFQSGISVTKITACFYATCRFFYNIIHSLLLEIYTFVQTLSVRNKHPDFFILRRHISDIIYSFSITLYDSTFVFRLVKFYNLYCSFWRKRRISPFVRFIHNSLTYTNF